MIDPFGKCGGLLLLFASIGISGPPVLAQEVSLRYQQPPYYVGEPVVVQVMAKGFDGNDEPVCRLAGALPNGVTIDGPQVRQSVSRFMQMDFGGRTTTQETVNYVFQFVLRADAAGEYAVGPFELEHNGRKRTIEARSFRFQELEDDADMLVSVSLPQSTLYVGQRVPVTIRWAMAGAIHEVQYAFENLEIRSPLFEEFDVVEASSGNRVSLTIATANGNISVGAEQTRQSSGGVEYVVLTGKATMVANTSGEFSSLPVTCRTKRGFAWRRQFFGGVQPGREAPARATGDVPDFVVKPLPLAGRPDSFAGAVGSGYAIDVSANRTVVRVGDPISLTLSLSGEGLEKMPLPDVSADGGLSPAQFQLPSEPPAGNYDGRTKQFKLNVRVKDEQVAQIPSLAFSWFDPQQEAYRTARSKPIALQVMPAQVLDANDVVSALPRESTAEPRGSQPASQHMTRIAAHAANLAIERDVQRLMRRSSGILGSPALCWGGYVMGLGLLVTGVVVRRRGDVDPAWAERRPNIKAWRRQIQQAPQLSGRESAQQVADALRKLMTVADASVRPSLDRVIARCEEAIYAPVEQGVWEDLVRQALQVVDRIEA